jgi:GT2 family glycosyltransferase
MPNNHFAILLTCHNRKAKTLDSLSHLCKFDERFEIYIVDDHSTDGTGEAIALQFPQVHLIKGNGDLYWNRGMLKAWEQAARQDYDFYLWLNDDVVLYENCFDELMACSGIQNHQAIISGIVEGRETKETLYGGTDTKKQLIVPDGEMHPITNLNGNVVLVPRDVYLRLGNLDPVYHHDLGDVDYGLRAKEHHIGVYTTRIAVASGDKNDVCRVRLSDVTMCSRFKRLYSPLGSNPAILFYFRRKHYGLINAAGYCLFLFIINVLPDTIVTFLFGERYN